MPVETRQEQDVNGTWVINSKASEINFDIQVMYLFNVDGTFPEVEGTIEIRQGLFDLEVDVRIDPSSVDTGNDKRDEHLREEDFFDVSKYPLIRFEGDQIIREAGDHEYSVTGQLTIKDVTEKISVPITFQGLNEMGQVVFTGSKNINRRTYHIDYTGRGVGDTAELSFRIVADRR